MSYLAQIQKNSLKVEVSEIPTIYIPPGKMVITTSKGLIYMSLGSKVVELTTLIAHNIGLKIAKAIPKLAPNEMITMVVNGERIDLLSVIASKLSTGLLVKADKADDFQLGEKNAR